MVAHPLQPLVGVARVTDVHTVRAVFEASYRRLVGQLYGVCGALAGAEEGVAEAFARAVQHERTFVRLHNPEAWVRTLAVNVSPPPPPPGRRPAPPAHPGGRP